MHLVNKTIMLQVKIQDNLDSICLLILLKVFT